MALVKCHECGNDVSSEAAACPKCGVRPKDKSLRTKIRSWIFRALALALVISALVAVVSSQSDSGKPEKSVATKGTARPAFSGSIEKEIAAAEKLNSQCRGGNGDFDSTMQACKKRDKEYSKLEEKGWCYGHEGQAGYEQTWEKCQAKPKPIPKTDFENPLVTGPSALVCPIDILFDKREGRGLKAAFDAHIKIFGHDEALAKTGCEEWRSGQRITLSDKAKLEAEEAQAKGECWMLETEGRLILSCELKNTTD